MKPLQSEKKNSFIAERRKRAGENVVANTNLHFQHPKTFVVPELHARVDTQLAASTPLAASGFTSVNSIIQGPVGSCITLSNPKGWVQCMNGGVFVESEPAALCSYFFLAQTFHIPNSHESDLALGSVPTVDHFELSFTLFLNLKNVQNYWTMDTDYGWRKIVVIQDPDNPNSKQPQVDISNSAGRHWLSLNWNQGPDWSTSQELKPFLTEMVYGGTYDIKIRVKSGSMKVYIDGCLKAERGIDITPAENQLIYAASPGSYPDINASGANTHYWVHGELTDIRYFSIGDFCSAFRDDGKCECSHGFSGSTVRSITLVRLRNLVVFEVFGVKFSAKKSIFQICPIKRAPIGRAGKDNFLNALYLPRCCCGSLCYTIKPKPMQERRSFCRIRTC